VDFPSKAFPRPKKDAYFKERNFSGWGQGLEKEKENTRKGRGRAFDGLDFTVTLKEKLSKKKIGGTWKGVDWLTGRTGEKTGKTRAAADEVRFKKEKGKRWLCQHEAGGSKEKRKRPALELDSGAVRQRE